MTVGEHACIEREIAALEGLDRSALLHLWRTAFGREAPPRLSRTLLRKAIAYDIQAKALGRLTARTIRALKIAAKPDSAAAVTSQLGTGAHLIREWNGILHEVEVMDDGYLWQGQRHRLCRQSPRRSPAPNVGPRFFGIKGG